MKNTTIRSLADFICGDNASKYPIRRSRKDLVRFFKDFEIELNQESEERKDQVFDTLKELNEELLKDIILCLAELSLHNDPHVTKLSINTLNKIIASENIEILLSGNVVSLESLKNTFNSSQTDNLKSMSNSTNRKIFISHSSKDEKFVKEIIEILEAINIPSKKIFCTSFDEYSIELGEDFLERIKSELNNETLVLFILSVNFYDSPISLCEMGATWVKTNEHIPILIPPFDFKDIKGVIPNTQGMKINDKQKLNSFKQKILSFFDLNDINQNTWERKRDDILNRINSLIANNSIGNENEIAVPIQQPDIQISKEAKNILLVASSGGGGILSVEVEEGRMVIIGGSSHDLIDEREIAKFDHNIKELKHNKLIEAKSHKQGDKYYEVTHLGYEYADEQNK